MSIKSCIKILPLVKNVISKPTCLSRKSVFNINYAWKTSYSLGTKIDTRIYSTEAKNEAKLIYYGVITPQIKAVKIFSLSSSIVGIIAQPFLYNEIAGTGNVPIIVAAYTFIGFFTVLTPILLNFVTKKYVTHMDYREKTDTYIARTVNFFCMTRVVEFSTEDVKVPDVPGLFTTFFAKGQPLFLDPRLFEQPEHYARIMGYDKPMDFKLYQTSEAEIHNKKDR